MSASFSSALLILLVTTRMVASCAVPVPINASSFRWDALEAVASRIPFSKDSVRSDEFSIHLLWNMYKNSTRLQRSQVMKDMSELLKEAAYYETRMDIIGLILLGQKAQTVLRLRKRHQGREFSLCLNMIGKKYRKHCGPLTYISLRHHYAFINICHYVKDKAMIEDAIIATCGLNSAILGIDTENPRMRITPAPLHGSSAYCWRASVTGVSRLKIQNYAKSYQVLVEDVPYELLNTVHVCFHRNASRGLCECEKGEWRSIKKESWDSFMSPYEQKFVDVKFTSMAYGYVTITLNEVPLVPLQLLRYASLAGGFGLLFLAWIEDQNNTKSDKWIMRVVGVICVLLSSFDTLMAMVALVSCLALQYVISSITELIYKKKRLLAWQKLRDSLTEDDSVDDYVAEWGGSAREFRDWVINNPKCIMLLSDDSDGT